MRAVIAEDLALLRDGIKRLLEDNDCEVVAAVEDADSLIDAIEELRPDVAVVDVRLPPSFRDEGIRAALEARSRVPGLPVLVLSLMAEGRSNQAIAADLVVTEGAVEKHISNIFGKLGLPPSEEDHRRVLAVLAWLGE